jgi:HlyD family secretion protein
MEKLRSSTDLGVTRAQKQVAIAEATLAESTVRSPLNGRVLKVLGRAGEHVGPVLFMIGDVSSMFVRAEVYESDAMRVKVGQKVTISSAALPGKLNGTVESLGTMIYKSTLESVDATAQTGSRVVETLIRLDPNAWSDRLINLQVDVIIRE